MYQEKIFANCNINLLYFLQRYYPIKKLNANFHSYIKSGRANVGSQFAFTKLSRAVGG